MLVWMSLLAGTLLPLAVAQGQAPPKELKQLEFWVGEWDCTGKSRKAPGKDEWTETKATNSVRWILDRRVVQENFTMGSYKGMSVSTYNPGSGKWHQTWVDGQGSYIPLIGGMQDGKMVLTTLTRPNAPNMVNRMVFSNIKPASFDWDWEASTDGGKTWELRWHLHYTRKAGKR
jgi:hypothetical protein